MCSVVLHSSKASLFVLQEFIVYESTFVGLQGLSAVHQQGSPELTAAEDALVTMLGDLAEQMRQAYDDEILYQVGSGRNLHA